MTVLGQLIDRLVLVSTAMWKTQEKLYEIRRMTYAEFRKRYIAYPSSTRGLWEILQTACMLNVERNKVIDQIDEEMVKIVQGAVGR